MSRTINRIQRVVLSGDYSALHCPFCGAQIVVCAEADSFKLTPCRHTLFIATDEGFEYRSDAFNSLKGIQGIPGDTLDIGEADYDGYTDDLSVANGIKFAIYAAAPSFFGAYFGFATLS